MKKYIVIADINDWAGDFIEYSVLEAQNIDASEIHEAGQNLIQRLIAEFWDEEDSDPPEDFASYYIEEYDPEGLHDRYPEVIE